MHRPETRTALIAGASGLVGSHLIKLLFESPKYHNVISVGRRHLDLSHSKLIQITTDFGKLADHRDELHAQDVFCCLGTTLSKAGSKEAFRKVDYDYPLALAAIAAQNQSEQFLLVSAQGANSQSRFFYNRVKGEVEYSISKLDLPAIHILRPSLLLGPRQERRLGELIAQKTSQFIPWVGAIKKYKPIPGLIVARAMLHLALKRGSGICYYASSEIAHYR